MADIDTTQGTWGWWLARLEKQLDDRASAVTTLEDYYSGRQPLAFASPKFREAFGGLFKAFADNWTALVVDAVEERLNVEGFRLGDDTEGDRQAWKIWQANQLDAESQIAHTEALVHGEASVLVWWGSDRSPEVTIEHPCQMIVATESGHRRRRTAALKRWIDDDGYEHATLYLPDGIYKFQSQHKPTNGARVGGIHRWIAREVPDETWPLANPLGVVPVVPLYNRPRLLGGGESEIASVIPVQDAINKLVADLLIASEYAAFRQRWATGLEIPRDPETDKPIEPFKAAVDRLWVTEASDAHFGEFTPSDLSNYVTAIEMLIQHVASQTRTPPHYFYLRGEFPSGDAIKSAETGLVAKARRKMRHFGEAWEEVIRLAFKVAGDDRAQITNSETLWGDPESRTESQHIDAVLKKQALGVPQIALWEDAGYSPTQIARFQQMLTDQPSPQQAGDRGGVVDQPAADVVTQ